VQVRAAAARDLDRVAALASLLLAHHAGEGARFALAPGAAGELAALLAAFRKEPERALLVADAGEGQLAGFVVAGIARRPGLFRERARGEIEWLFVREEARRAGVGRALADAALRFLAEQGVARVEVQVARANAGGAAFWQALGFAATMDVRERHL
jgi:ribosomal protein S18 acetylase RimI-like enzyme